MHITTERQLPLFDTIEIPLTKGFVSQIDPVDSDLAAFKWIAAIPASGPNYAYAMRKVSSRLRVYATLHRVILARVLGRDLSRNEHVDHINHDTLDNRRCNLRLATRSQNMQNRKRNANNTSGYKGVCYRRLEKKWVARISVNGKRLSLGRFNSPEEAFEAYRQASKKYHGEFGKIE